MVKRINSSLRQRGYQTWLDVDDMRGSTVDAMSEAVDGASVVLIGVARAYKGAAAPASHLHRRRHRHYTVAALSRLPPLIVA